MKLPVPCHTPRRRERPTADQGFTLPEILIATTVFLLMLAGVIAANLFGLKMFQITETKLNVATWSRQTVETMAGEVHTCNSVQVGNVTTNGVFAGLLNGEKQQGNGLLIYPSTNSSSFIIYFVNSTDTTFRKTVAAASSTNTTILADSVTNFLAFTAQDYSGTPLTNNLNNRVIHLTLEFYQPARFMEKADYYRLETSLTRRSLQ